MEEDGFRQVIIREYHVIYRSAINEMCYLRRLKYRYLDEGKDDLWLISITKALAEVRALARQTRTALRVMGEDTRGGNPPAAPRVRTTHGA